MYNHIWANFKQAIDVSNTGPPPPPQSIQDVFVKQRPIPTKAKITRTNILIPVEKLLSQEMTMCNMEALVSYP